MTEPLTTDADTSQAANVETPAATFTKDDVERIVKERLDRAQKRAEAEQAKAADEARTRALAEQGEWKTLAEQHATRITELEGVTRTMQTVEQERDRYKTAVTALLKTQRTDLPQPIQDLLDKLDPVDQLEWIAKNRQAVAGQAGTPTRTSAARAGAQPAAADPNRRSTVNF